MSIIRTNVSETNQMLQKQKKTLSLKASTFPAAKNISTKLLIHHHFNKILIRKVYNDRLNMFFSFCQIEQKVEARKFMQFSCQIQEQMSRNMTKPTKWMCAQRRLRSAWASAQPDQSLRCALNGSLSTQAFFMWTAKPLIRLGGCPGWSASSLGAHAILLVLSCRGSNAFRTV